MSSQPSQSFQYNRANVAAYMLQYTCCAGGGADEEWRACGLVDAVVGCVHKCLLYNREDTENTHDVGGLFTIDCMKMLMSPLVDQVVAVLCTQ